MLINSFLIVVHKNNGVLKTLLINQYLRINFFYLTMYSGNLVNFSVLFFSQEAVLRSLEYTSCTLVSRIYKLYSGPQNIQAVLWSLEYTSCTLVPRIYKLYSGPQNIQAALWSLDYTSCTLVHRIYKLYSGPQNIQLQVVL